MYNCLFDIGTFLYKHMCCIQALEREKVLKIKQGNLLMIGKLVNVHFPISLSTVNTNCICCFYKINMSKV